MPEFLEMTASKFTFRVATDRVYSAEGVWVVRLAGEDKGRIRVGLSDFTQQHSGDVTFFYPPEAGAAVTSGGDLGVVETMKTTITVACPLSGKVVAVNTDLDLHPERVNQDPYGGGWLVELEPTRWEQDRATLLEPTAYFDVMRTQVERELETS